jgi:c-di-GMP-related signal transduction protein
VLLSPWPEPLFINCTRNIPMSEPIIPANRCVLKILDHVDLDAELPDRIRALRRREYRVALDDFHACPDCRGVGPARQAGGGRGSG